MRRIYLLAILLIVGFVNESTAQVPTCSADVPYYFVDMTGVPDSVYISPGHSRQGNCCATVAPDRCTSFDVKLDPNAAMISFEIASGSIPPGSMFYQIDCGPQIPVGQPICMVGVGPFHVTFCKPGNNQNTYRITSIPKPLFPPDATVRLGCSKILETMGMVPSSVTWNSIYPGISGQYNSYLSCSSGCIAPLYTPTATAPPYIDYQICGSPIASSCGYVATCDTVRIYNLPALTASVSPASAFFCSGGGGVLLTASSAGGNGVYSYVWRDDHGNIVGTSSTYNATAAGTYILEARDGLYDPSLCPPVLINVPVTVGLPPVVNAGPDQTVCTNSPTTYLNASYSNATGGVWTGGAGTFSPNNTTPNAAYTPSAGEIAAGSVTLTFTSTGAGGGCSNMSDDVVLTFPPLLTSSLASIDLSCNNSTTVLNPNAAGGVGPYAYNWSNGATTSTITVGAGNYCVNVSDSKGCVTTSCANITVPPALSLSMSSTDATTIGGTDGTATATVSGGTTPYTYSWSPGGETTATIINLSYGIYSVTVADSKGCSISMSTVVNDPHCLNLQTTTTVTNPHCYGDLSGTIDAVVTGGTLPYSYTWNTSPVQTGATASVLSIGTYMVTVTDGSGCVDVQGAVITEPAQLTNVMNHTNATAVGGSNGSATANPAGGTGPYTYLWNNGGTTATITGLSTGTYIVTITDNAGCSLIDSTHVYDPTCSSMVLNVYGTNVSCHGGNNGSATAQLLFGSGPYTYHWNTGATTASITGLSAGVYTVVAYGSSLCPLFGSITITEPSTLSLGVAATNITCAPLDNGTIDLSVSGGTFPYTYNWSNGITVEDQFLLTTGTYSVIVTDAMGCTAGTNATINRPATLATSGTHINVTCNGGNDGSLDASISGGISPYGYSWSNGSITQDQTGLSAGQYILVATDANGCHPSENLSILIDEPEVVSIDSANVACPMPGSGVTAVTVFPNGGNLGPYQVSFNNGITFQPSGVYTASLAIGTTYTIYAKDGNGCLSSAFTLIIKPAVSIINASFATCFAPGTTTTTVTATPAGGSGGALQISFDNGLSYGPFNSYSANLPIASSYSIIARDSSGCESMPYAITIPDILASSTISSTYAGGYNVHCNGSSDGSINLTVSGGTTAYTYNWSGPSGYSATAADISGLSAGNYTVSITDANLCNISSVVTLTEPAPLASSATSPTVAGGYNITCQGLSDGSVNLSTTGGSVPYTYSWTGPAGYNSTSQNITGIGAGTYAVTTTDGNGCIANANLILTEPSALSAVSVSPGFAGGNNVSCNGSSDGSIDLSVSGGTASYSYSWSGPAGYTSSTEDLSALTAGSYSVLITDANACTTTSGVTLTEPALFDGTLSSFTYNGGYSISCNGNADGSIDLNPTGGSTPYSFSWSNGSTSQNISGLSAGSYTVVATDANGCNFSQNATLNEPVVLSSTVTSPVFIGGANISCNAATDGAIDLTVAGGTGPYSYAWTGPASYNSTTEDINGLMAGVYNVGITDDNGCTSSASITLVQPAPIVISISSDTVVGGYNIHCNGNSDGDAMSSITGGTASYLYAWTGPGSFSANTNSLAGLTAGTYSLAVTDVNGCTSASSITLTEPLLLATSLSSATYNGGYNVSCNGSSDGTISTTVGGGQAPYTYAWSNGATTQNLSAIGAGSYTLTISDINNCLVSANTLLSEPAVLSNTLASPTFIGGNNISCFGSADGSVDLTVSGGTTPYSTNWTGSGSFSSTTEDLSGLSSGNYSVLITDANGCTDSATITFTQPTALNANLSSSTFTGGANISCNGNTDGAINMTVTGGTSGYTYNWSGPAGYSSASEDLNLLQAGTYTVIVTDTNACTATNTITLAEPEPLVSSASLSSYNGSNITCFGSNTGNINFTVNGGTSGYTFSWNNGMGYTATTEDIDSLYAGTYAVTVTDMNGCNLDTNFTLTQPPVLSDNITSTPATCLAATGACDLSIAGGTQPYSSNWSNGYTTEDLNNVTGGTYSVLITDQNGCMLMDTTTIQSISIIALSSTANDILCHGNNIGSIDLTVENAVTPVSYVWSTGATSPSISNLPAGMYTVTVTDGYGCIVNDTFAIVESSQIDLTLASDTYTGGFNVSSNGGNDGVIDLTVSGGNAPYSFTWSNGESMEDLQNLPAGYYSVIVVDSLGCNALGSIILTEPFSLEMPTGFSPNGDGKNDNFVIHGIEIYPDNELVIYNRWGNIVNKFTGYNNEWDGKSNNGEWLPNGTYFVVLTIKGKDMVLTGYVDLRK